MKKFLAALIVGLIICAGVKVEAAQLTQEQFDKMFSITAQNPDVKDKSLALDATTFQKNFNDFMTNFIKESNATGDDAKNMEEIFLMKEPVLFQADDKYFLAKNFLNQVAIVGFLDEQKNLKVLNFFYAKASEKNEVGVTVLVLEAFAKSISPDLSAEILMGEFEKNQNAPVIKNGVKFSIALEENLNTITAVAE